MANEDLIKRAAAVVPSDRQLKWQEMEFYAFAHFGINTFSGKMGTSGAWAQRIPSSSIPRILTRINGSRQSNPPG